MHYWHDQTCKTCSSVKDLSTLRALLSGSFLQTARFSYATKGALFISAQLSTDMVGTFQKVWVLIWLWKQWNTQAHT